MPEEYNPIFIVGCGRSGTTLLRLILNRHSLVAIPEETWFFPELHKRMPNILLKRGWKHEVARTIFELNPIHFPGLRPADLMPVLNRTEQHDISGIIASINRSYALRVNKPIWGDKTPGYVLYLPLIKRIYPDAKVIHMIRDPRDVVESLLNNWSAGPQTSDFRETVDYWVRNVSAGRRDGPRYFGANYTEVYFEKVVENPQKEIPGLCDFLEIPYEDQMLEVSTDFAEIIPDWEHHKKTQHPIDPGMAFKWKKDYPDYKLSYINIVAGSMLQQLGYFTSHKLNIKAIIHFILKKLKDGYNYSLLRFKVFAYNMLKLKYWRR